MPGLGIGGMLNRGKKAPDAAQRSPDGPEVALESGGDAGKYEGEYKVGMYHGAGTMTWRDGCKYEGEWRESKQHGKGTYTWSDGRQYTGDFVNGRKEGTGVLKFRNGDRYEGQWHKGNYHGSGKFTWADGSTYEGGYRDSQKHGMGVFTWANGKHFEGFFQNGAPVIAENGSALPRTSGHRTSGSSQASPQGPSNQLPPVQELSIEEATEMQISNRGPTAFLIGTSSSFRRSLSGPAESPV